METINASKKQHAAKGSKKGQKKKILLIIIFSIALILIAFRLALPSILCKVVNQKLTEIEGYEGHVNDIDVWLIRGAYAIKGIELNKTGGKIPVPFFSADVADISIEWRALFHGAIVAEIVVQNPILNFVNGPTPATSQTKIDSSWVDVVDALIPFKLNRFELRNGQIHYRDYHSSPKIDMFMRDVYVTAENLTNTTRSKDTLPSTVVSTAQVYGGQLRMNMKVNPLNETPTFDMNVQLTTINLVDLNDFLKAYGKFDVEKGTISIYAEAAAKNNKIVGYTKPIIKDLKVVDLEKDAKQPLHLVWESVVGFTAWVFKNHPKDQLATKIEFEGNLDNPKIDIWALIGQTLFNAFIQALYPSIENSITIQSVGTSKDKQTILQKLFNKSSENNKKENTKPKNSGK
jgi:hypothetical protein